MGLKTATTLELQMRFSPAAMAVELMRTGSSPADAASEAIRRIQRFYPDFFGALVAVNRLGETSAACSGIPSGRFDYSLVNGATGGKVMKQSVKCL